MDKKVRFTPEAEDDLLRLYDFLLSRGNEGIEQAEQVLETLNRGLDFAAFSPWGCRKAEGLEPIFRELIVSWGSAGYVLLFEIETDEIITVLAVRHQKEADWH